MELLCLILENGFQPESGGRMTERSKEGGGDMALLATALRAIRKSRRMRTSEIAQAMEMPVRSYEHFEAGQGRITYDRLLRFAEATNCDPVALLAVGPMQSPEFAERCADNKLMQIVMIALSELNDDLGEDIVYLESGAIIGGMTRLCRDLAEHVRKRDTFAETWLEQKAPRLHRQSAPRPGGLKPGVLR